MSLTPLRANQVRTRVNNRFVRTYYIVTVDESNKFHCMWFRSDPDKPMMLIDGEANYVPKESDIVVLENINLLTSTFADIVKTHT